MTETLLPHLHNVRAVGNRISSAADLSYLGEAESDQPYLDQFYGHVWNFTPRPGAAVYGRTLTFPAAPNERLGTGRFLRVPFRRVPVVEVSSLERLELIANAIWSKDPSNVLMWRGQPRSYTLERDQRDQLILYGETGIPEPSLLSSAARAGIEFRSIFESWSAILDVFIDERLGALCLANPSATDELKREAFEFRASYRYRLWAFATAQHYGLPSVGLDVTDSLDVAVAFALHKFVPDPATGRTTFIRQGNDARPIIYAMGAFIGDIFADRRLAPAWLQASRPKAQSAFFHATGWGKSPNKAAEHILFAFELTQHSDWKLRRPVESLFPSRDDDPFLRFLRDANARFSDIAHSAWLDRIYEI